MVRSAGGRRRARAGGRWHRGPGRRDAARPEAARKGPPGRRRRRPRGARHEADGDPAGPPPRVRTRPRLGSTSSRGLRMRSDELVAEGHAIVNRALHAHRAGDAGPRRWRRSGEPGAGDHESATGPATSSSMASSRTRSRSLPPPVAAARTEALRPQERLAATLGRREADDTCETLLLRASGRPGRRAPARGGAPAARGPRGASGRGRSPPAPRRPPAAPRRSAPTRPPTGRGPGHVGGAPVDHRRGGERGPGRRAVGRARRGGHRRPSACVSACCGERRILAQ